MEINALRSYLLIGVALSLSVVASCAKSTGPIVSPIEEMDFEGDVTKFNESYKDSAVFVSSRSWGVSMMYKGGGRINTLATQWDAFNATWSPRKWKVFYVAETNGDAGRVLFVMNADGSGNQRISAASEDVWGAACAPDGKKLAYIVLGNSGKGKIRIAGPDGSGAHDITGFILLNQSHKLTWSPDSRRIAFDGLLVDYPLARLWVIGTANADGSQVGALFQPTHQCFEPDWSPDGTKIAYVTWTLVGDTYYPKIFYYDLTTQKSSQVTSDKSYDNGPHWSPDSRQIIFASSTSSFYTPSFLFMITINDPPRYQVTFGTSTTQDWDSDW